MIEALKVFKNEVAESKGQLPLACREPERGYGRGSRGNTSGSGEQDVVQQPGLSELIAELARSAADPGGSAGGVDKTPLSFSWKSVPDCATGSGEAAVTSSGAAQGITGKQAGASVDEKELMTWILVIASRCPNINLAISSSNAPPSWARPAPTAAMPQGRPPHGEPQLRCRATSAGLIHTLSHYPRVFKTSLNLPV
jgi:hypothetical protein